MDVFASQIINFVNSARPFVIAITAAALLILGIMFIYPNERSKERAKDAAPWLVIGIGVALSAVALANSLGGSF